MVVGCRKCVPNKGEGRARGRCGKQRVLVEVCAGQRTTSLPSAGLGAGLHSTRLGGRGVQLAVGFWLFPTDCRGFVDPLLAAERLNKPQNKKRR